MRIIIELDAAATPPEIKQTTPMDTTQGTPGAGTTTSATAIDAGAAKALDTPVTSQSREGMAIADVNQANTISAGAYAGSVN